MKCPKLSEEQRAILDTLVESGAARSGGPLGSP